MIFIGFLLFFGTACLAQKVLLFENIYSLKNYKYYPGEKITLRLSYGNSRFSDNILDLSDSSVVFEGIGEVNLNNISCIYRENWLVRTLSGLSFLGGVAYFGVDSFNRWINHEWPAIQTETMLISGSMVLFSVALLPFRYTKIKTSEKWQLKSINLEAY